MLAHRLGDVVGTFAWNTTRHLEAWYGVMGLGAICHTLNPRLSDRDITYIAGVVSQSVGAGLGTTCSKVYGA
jgi:fatty-acyl-CoA synthase